MRSYIACRHDSPPCHFIQLKFAFAALKRDACCHCVIGTGGISVHWNQIALNALPDGTSLQETAALFAMLNVALADARITYFTIKYRDLTWRPVTALRYTTLAADNPNYALHNGLVGSAQVARVTSVSKSMQDIGSNQCTNLLPMLQIYSGST